MPDHNARSWASLFSLCRVPYGLVVLVGIGLLVPTQLHDMLAAVETGPEVVALSISMGLFALLNWYWARTVISAHFGLEPSMAWPEACKNADLPEDARWPLQLVAYGPLALCFVIYLLLSIQSGLWIVYAASGLAIGPVMVFVWFRRGYEPRINLIFPLVALVGTAVYFAVRIKSSCGAPSGGCAASDRTLLCITVPMIVFLALPYALSLTERRSIALWSGGLAALSVTALFRINGYVASVSVALALIPGLWEVGKAVVDVIRRNDTLIVGFITELSHVAERIPTMGVSPRAVRAVVKRSMWLLLRLIALALLLTPGVSLILEDVFHGDQDNYYGSIVLALLAALPLLIPVVIRLKTAISARGAENRKVVVAKAIARVFWLAVTIVAFILVASAKDRPWDQVVFAAVLAAIPMIAEETDETGWSLARLTHFAPIDVKYAWTLLIVGTAIVIATGALALAQSDFGYTAAATFYPYLLNVSPVLLAGALVAGPLSALAFLSEGYRWRLSIPGLGLATSKPFAPPLLLLVTYWTLIAPYWFPLHSVRTMAKDEGGDVRTRLTLEAHWETWEKKCHGRRPIIVAISGGASRAGLAGAAALERIDEIARATGNNGAIYAISSVSGGSLGAAAYVTRFPKESTIPKDSTSCTLPANANFTAFAKSLGEADAIGPLLAASIFADIPRALFGFSALVTKPGDDGDRASALEHAFEVNAAAATKHHEKDGVAFDESLLNLQNAPLWLANGTERDTGARMLTTQVRPDDDGSWPFLGASDALGQLCLSVRISTAINNTARFPFLEPAGAILRDACPTEATAKIERLAGAGSALDPRKATPVSIIDGGYFDNSGLESALELAEWLDKKNADPIIVAVSGDGDSSLQPGQVVRCNSARFNPTSGRKQQHVWEPLGPVFGLYNVRSGHVDLLLRHIASTECTGGNGPFFHLYLPAFGKQEVPLNWVLSKDMANYIWGAMAGEVDAKPEHLTKEEMENYNGYLEGNKNELARLRAMLSVKYNPDAKDRSAKSGSAAPSP